MPRQARIVIPGAAHHVTQRGNYRQDVFFTQEDRRLYLQYLRESARQNGLEVTAYCLMSNHVHLIVVPEREESLSRALGRTHLMYAQYIHQMHGRQGHLWQSRFYSNPMDDDHAWQAAAYVELNPVRAGMVRTPWEYTWSSAAVHSGKADDKNGVLALAAWRQAMPDTNWREHLRAIAANDKVQAYIRGACRTGRPLGNDVFIAKVEAFIGHRLPRYGRGRPRGSKDKQPRKKEGQ
jgi:putative transposase